MAETSSQKKRDVRAFLRAVHPLTWLVVLGAAFVCGGLAFLDGWGPDLSDSKEFQRRMAASGVLVLLIALGAGYLAFRFSVSGAKAANVAMFVPALVLVMVGVNSMRPSPDSNDRVIEEMGREMEALRREQEQLQREDPPDLSALSAIQEKIVNRTRHYAGQLEGPLATFLEKLLEFEEEVTVARARYGEALSPVLAGDYMDMGAVEGLPGLDRRIEQATALRERAMNFKEALQVFKGVQEANSRLKRKSERRHAGMVLGQYSEQIRGIEEVLDLDREFATLLIEAFGLVKREWNGIERKVFLGDLVMEDKEAEARIGEIMRRLDDIGRRQAELQGSGRREGD